MINELQLTPEEEQQIMGKMEEENNNPTPSTEPEPVIEPTITEPAPVQQPDNRTVPLAALHEARAELKELRRLYQESTSKLSTLDKLKQDILAIRESNKKPEPTVPDYNEDPLGNLSQRVNQQEQKISTYDMESARRNQEMEAQKHQSQLINTVVYHEQEFSKTTPDYLDAVNYMRELRKNELSVFGVTDPVQVNEELRKNAIALSSFAVNQGKNPAELMYTIAKQYGYKTKTTNPAPNPAPSTIDTITKGETGATKTLSGKGITEGNLTAEGLLNLEGEEFETAWKKLFG